MAGPAHSFGSCCQSLKDALSTDDFEPLIHVAEDGILYLSLGLIPPESDQEDPSMIDHPVFFCPFCGTNVQKPEDVDAKMGPGA